MKVLCPKCGGVLYENELTNWFECSNCSHQELNRRSLEVRVKTLEEKIKIFEKEMGRMTEFKIAVKKEWLD